MRRPTLATLALSLLALLFGWEARQALRATPGGQDNAAPAPAGAWQPGIATADPQPPPDPGPMVSAITARPLFRQDRQPFREQTAGASARNVEAELSRFTLLGVLGFGDVPYGVVVGKGGSKGERWEVRKGDSFQGFTVQEVGMDGLRVTAEDRELLLPLYAGAPTAAGGAVRTETTRRDAAQPASRAATPASASGAPLPGQATPSASPVPSRARRPSTVPLAPGASPAPLPSDTSPTVAPRYIPGRR
jgi:hypothetical protein